MLEPKEKGDIMRIGDKGERIRHLQAQLNKSGAQPMLITDGLFGEKTEAAVIAFQRRHGISAIGIAGPRTQRALAGLNDPRRIGQSDFERASRELGVTVAAVAAVAEVESAGRGFFDDGRPVILYERHVFYRLAEPFDSEQANIWAVKYPNLCSTRPGGYTGGPGEHQRLRASSQLDRLWALESCSWGMFQIMGFHYQRLGYTSVQDMVNALSRSEGEQLNALVRFIKTDKSLHQALKARKWGTFARIYNGPAYKKNLYDIKLARTYQHFSDVYAEAATA